MATSTEPHAPSEGTTGSSVDAEDTAVRLAARARRYRAAAEAGSTHRQEAVCFVRVDTTYSIPLHNLREIRRFTNPCRLPGMRSVVAAVIHYRGMLISVHDLDGLMHPEATNEAGGWVVIVEHDGELFGLLADEVLGTRAFGDDDIRTLPVTFPKAGHVFRGLIDDTLLIQPAVLFSDSTFISAY